MAAEEKKAVNPEEAAAEQEQEGRAAAGETAEQEADVTKLKKGKKAEEALRQERDDLQKQLEQASAEAGKLKDQLLRTAAEYDNFRKRSDREKKAIYADATADAVTELLSVADNLERALAQEECSAEDLRKGVEMVLNQLHAAFHKLNVSEMGAVGEPFDPALHNAVSHVEDEALEENVISQVFQKGYRIGEKVIRHAMVQVAN